MLCRVFQFLFATVPATALWSLVVAFTSCPEACHYAASYASSLCTSRWWEAGVKCVRRIGDIGFVALLASQIGIGIGIESEIVTATAIEIEIATEIGTAIEIMTGIGTRLSEVILRPLLRCCSFGLSARLPSR